MLSPTSVDDCDHEIVGTKLFGSVQQNRGLKVGKKDDVESAILCILRLLLKSLGIEDIPWKPKTTEGSKVNQMISLKVELLNFSFLWGFFKEKTSLTEELELKKAYISLKSIVDCFKLS